jgi:hypothetical protein
VIRILLIASSIVSRDMKKPFARKGRRSRQ